MIDNITRTAINTIHFFLFCYIEYNGRNFRLKARGTGRLLEFTRRSRLLTRSALDTIMGTRKRWQDGKFAPSLNFKYHFKKFIFYYRLNILFAYGTECQHLKDERRERERERETSKSEFRLKCIFICMTGEMR